VGLEPILSSGEETDEEDELAPSSNLRPRSLYAKGPVVIGVEKMLHAEEDTERVVVESATILERETASEREIASQSERDLLRTGLPFPQHQRIKEKELTPKTRYRILLSL